MEPERKIALTGLSWTKGSNAVPWIILSEDHPEKRHLRDDEALMQAHMKHQRSIQDRILAAGSTRADDGETPTGGLLILDVESRAEAEAFFNADPFTKAGLRANVTITFWFKAFWDGVQQF